MDDEEREQRRALVSFFHERWGTDDSVTLSVFAPSIAGDPGYRAWEPRYERQSATPAAIGEILEMIEAIDVRPLLPAVATPTLLLHRRDDGVAPIALARETEALLPVARLVELDGHDHFPHVGDVDTLLDHYERFVAGTVTRSTSQPVAPEVRLTTMGGFRAEVGGQLVATNAWGSRQARVVCKRLAVAGGQPVPRDELTELLWPDEWDPARCSARLSVVLSNIRRVLRGGLMADRDTVRLDLDAVELDLVELSAAIASGDDAGVVARYRGPVLPEDAYEDWATDARQRFAAAVGSARRRLANEAVEHERWDEVVDHARAMLELDGFDERAHELLVRALLADGRRGDARTAADRYGACMAELGVQPRDLLAGDAAGT